MLLAAYSTRKGETHWALPRISSLMLIWWCLETCLVCAFVPFSWTTVTQSTLEHQNVSLTSYNMSWTHLQLHFNGCFLGEPVLAGSPLMLLYLFQKRISGLSGTDLYGLMGKYLSWHAADNAKHWGNSNYWLQPGKNCMLALFILRPPSYSRGSSIALLPLYRVCEASTMS